MNIQNHAEMILRDAGYETWSTPSSSHRVVCFESAALMGFIYVFDDVQSLIDRWEGTQRAVLSRYASALRSSGDKAWNIYSVFLTMDEDPLMQRLVARIEENFELTRKIVRTSLRNSDDVEQALLPLLGVKASPLLGNAVFEERLRARLSDHPPASLTAFFEGAEVDEVARLLGVER